VQQKPLSFVAFLQLLKVSALGMLFTICLWFFSFFLPIWLVGIIFFAVIFFVLVPIFFGVGPLGRKYGNEINEVAIEQARRRRERDNSSF